MHNSKVFFWVKISSLLQIFRIKNSTKYLLFLYKKTYLFKFPSMNDLLLNHIDKTKTNNWPLSII
jgi:hypothetical protein